MSSLCAVCEVLLYSWYYSMCVCVDVSVPNPCTFIVFVILSSSTPGSKVDLRRYVEGAGADELECEVRRYKTEGIPVHWPSHGSQEYDRWFTCTLKHTEGLFAVTAFLRHTPAAPPTGLEDYRSKLSVEDGASLITAGKTEKRMGSAFAP